MIGLSATPPVPQARAGVPRISPDDAPTAARCRAYGYNLADNYDEETVYGGGAGGTFNARGSAFGGMAPYAQAYPPPPPPPPPPSPTTGAPPPPMAADSAAQPQTSAAGRSGVAAPINRPGPATGYVGGYPPPGEDTERYPGAVANPVRRVAEAPVSTFSIDVDTAAYANVRRFLNEGEAPPREAVRVEELINYFDYHYPLPVSRRDPFRVSTALAPAPWARGHQILHIGIQGYNIPRTERPPLNLVFLVDTSGSMMAPDRLALAVRALNVLVNGLRPQDRVSLVAYAGSAGEVLGPTRGNDRLRIRCALGALQAGGSTAGGQGLSLAYKLARDNFSAGAVNRVILMTDGDFNVGVSDPSRLRDYVSEQRSSGIYLSVYGFGRGNYNDTMMQALAQNGNGIAGYIDSLEEARRVFRNDFASSVFPIANDVKIQVEFNPRYVSEYRLIGYETRMLNREDFNNDTVDAGEVGSGASVTALYEITPTGATPASDPLRYQDEAPQAAVRGAGGGELAFVKLRYKRPGEPNSNLMSQPVLASQAYASLRQAPEATRWAVAVAAYGQRLRGDPAMVNAFSWEQIASLARSAVGDDEDGLRAQFLQLVRAARDLAVSEK